MQTDGRPFVANRAFRALALRHSLSSLGRSLYSIALVILVYDRTGSGLAVAGVLLAVMVPSLVAPFVGVVSDRIDRRVAMAGSDLTSTLLVSALAFADHLAVVYLLVAALGVLVAISTPATMASVPELVGPQRLTSANSVLNLIWTASLLAGRVLGGTLVSAVGMKYAFLVSAGTFLVCAGLVGALPSLRPLAGLHGNLARGLAEGMRFAASASVPLAVIVTGFFLVFFAAAPDPATVVLAKDVLDGGDVGYGILSASWPAGMLVGSTALLVASTRSSPRRVYLLSLLLEATGIGLTGAAPGLSFAVACRMLGGMGNGLDYVAMNTLIQQSTPNAVRARVLSLFYASQSLANASAVTAGGALVDLVSVRLVYFTAGLGLLSTWLLALLLLRPSAASDLRTAA